jgi:rhamnosyltransferase
LKFALVIPTLNAGPWLKDLCQGIESQSAKPEIFIVVDSASTDNTVAQLTAIGAKVVPVARKDFDHGKTRQDAIALLPPDIDIVVLLTQDAILTDSNAVSRLLAAFDDPQTGMAYGRQLPRPDAGAIEAHARLFRYGAVPDTADASSFSAKGLQAAFCSNSFAAYRLSALAAVGGFPRRCIFGEDTITAVRMMKKGWKKAYVADACVRHSHDYSHLEEFRRYFDIGVLHQTTPEIRDLRSRSLHGEGKRFLVSELDYLRRNDFTAIPDALVRTVLKYAAYRLGGYFRVFPDRWRRALSLNPGYWTLPVASNAER